MMRFIKVFFLYLWGPINLVLLRQALRSYGYHTVKIGESTFHGPAEFLRTCEEAMADLSKLDSQAYRALTVDRQYTFWYGRHLLVCDLFTGVFSIDDTFLQWGTFGITARLVEAYYSTLFIKRQLRSVFHKSDANKKVDQMKDCTRSWLISHNYPSELVECFG